MLFFTPMWQKSCDLLPPMVWLSMRSLEKPREPGDTMTKKDGFKDTVSNFLGKNVVPIIVGAFIVLTIPISGLSGTYILQQILMRVSRDLFLILSLLFPIMAGMGLNFGMALGAMSGQIAIILVLNWGVPGVGGVFLAMAVATPMAILSGWLCGVILNKARGHEMITSMMLGYAMSGVYMLIGLSLIHISEPTRLGMISYAVFCLKKKK